MALAARDDRKGFRRARAREGEREREREAERERETEGSQPSTYAATGGMNEKHHSRGWSQCGEERKRSAYV